MRTLVIGCGALSRELLDIVDRNGLQDAVTVECLPARLHNTPAEIPGAVAERIERAGDTYDRILVGYADCGTGGDLDRVLEGTVAERLEGAHCYEFYATASVFADEHESEPGTFYLTDFLVRHFDRIVVTGLGLDRHPQLRDDYFGNYVRVLHLAQHDDPGLERQGRLAAERLGLAYERRVVGYGALEPALVRFGGEDGGTADHDLVA
ncbi:MAG: DUF1638 domain-containing protein [Acidimicrobiia bacterium]|nr:DUF1638 domain-containing protein [Acidimicrobiia bacterium]